MLDAYAYICKALDGENTPEWVVRADVNSIPNVVEVEVLDCFSGMGKEESSRYIRICREIEAITEGQNKD